MTGSPAGEGANCPVCGAENPAGSRFCERCGTRLPQRPREAATAATSAEITPPVSRDDATVTFQQLPSLLPEAQSREDDAPVREREFEPTLIGTPPVGDDTPRSEAAEGPQSSEAREAAVEMPSAPQAPSPEAPPTDSLRDRATMTFELPDLSTREGTNETRNAPTMAFELPKLPDTDQSPAAATPSESASEAPDKNAANTREWNYQSWRPDPAANQSATSGASRPAIDRDEAAQAPPTPATPPEMPSSTEPTPPVAPPALPQTPSAGTPPAFPTVEGNTGASSWPPAATPPAFPSGPPPSSTYPSVSAGQSATPPAYSQTPAAAPPGGVYGPTTTGAQASAIPAYPTSGEQRNNRALWIILGVIGGIFVLCILACVLLFVLGAINGASASTAFATVVPTITR